MGLKGDPEPEEQNLVCLRTLRVDLNLVNHFIFVERKSFGFELDDEVGFEED